jgi:hypothetical protein
VANYRNYIFARNALGEFLGNHFIVPATAKDYLMTAAIAGSRCDEAKVRASIKLVAVGLGPIPDIIH